jgi:hypothetical protein
VSYDRNTGHPVDYYLVDTINTNSSSNSLAVVGDELIIDVSYFYPLFKTGLFKINKHTKEVNQSMHITYDRAAECTNMSVSSNGWVFRSEQGEGATVENGPFVGNYSKACVITVFYDSALDMHRPHPCPGVDSLWGAGVEGHTVTISWTSQTDHIGYELAYIPQEADWDDATILECTSTTTTVTLPDAQCYQFRIRGLCDSNRVAASPWSDPITVCPQVGLDEIDNLGSAVIYPNPAKEQLTVSTSAPVESLQLINTLGQAVLTYNPTTTVTTLDVSHLQRGVYLLRINSSQGVAIRKLLLW